MRKMRFAVATLAAACFVQLFAPACGWPQPDQLQPGSPEIDNGFAGPPLHVYAQPALRKRQSTAETSSSSESSSSTSASGSITSSSSSTGTYTNSTMSSTKSSTSSTSSSTSSSAKITTSSTSSKSSSTTSSSTSASASPTTVNVVTFEIQNNTIYSGTLLQMMRKRAMAGSIDMCLNKCAANSTCQGTAYDNSTDMCTYYSSVDRNSQMAKNGTTFALVENRPANSTTTSSSSTTSQSMNSTSSHPTTMSTTSTSSHSTTSSMNTTSGHSSASSSSSTSSHSSTVSSNTTSSTSATPTMPVGARSCNQIAASGNTFTDSNNVTYAVICAKAKKRMVFDHNTMSRRQNGDLGTVQSGSFEGCAPYCDSNQQCDSYSYDPSSGTCYLMSNSNVSQPIAGRDYAYKVQKQTSSSSTSTASSTTSSTTSSTSSSSTSDFVPDGYSVSKTTICSTPSSTSTPCPTTTPCPSATSSSFLSLGSSSASSGTPSPSSSSLSSTLTTSSSSSSPTSSTVPSTSSTSSSASSSSSVSSTTSSPTSLSSSSSTSSSPSSSPSSTTSISSASARVRVATQVRMVAAHTSTIDSEAPAVQTEVSVQTMGAVVTSYSIVSDASTVTIIDTATSVSSVYTSTKQVAPIRRSTVTAVQSVQASTIIVGAVTVTSDFVVPSGYTTVTASGSTVTENIDRTVATDVATVTAPGNTITTTLEKTVATGVATVTAPVVTEDGSSTITSGISTVTEQAIPATFKIVYRRDEEPLKDDKAGDNDESKDDEKKGGSARTRPWFAFDGMTEVWM